MKVSYLHGSILKPTAGPSFCHLSLLQRTRVLPTCPHVLLNSPGPTVNALPGSYPTRIWPLSILDRSGPTGRVTQTDSPARPSGHPDLCWLRFRVRALQTQSTTQDGRSDGPGHSDRPSQGLGCYWLVSRLWAPQATGSVGPASWPDRQRPPDLIWLRLTLRAPQTSIAYERWTVRILWSASFRTIGSLNGRNTIVEDSTTRALSKIAPKTEQKNEERERGLERERESQWWKKAWKRQAGGRFQNK